MKRHLNLASCRGVETKKTRVWVLVTVIVDKEGKPRRKASITHLLTVPAPIM